ncbi:MAG: type II toxin-antitoxin system death-on-curing family toxin [Alphaproteobacteria bacterium]|nr:type II toxin-antitoxin system death-on-curing family toxin [Alphaproteobacteria bacterium]
MSDIEWLERQSIELLHAESIGEHGGLPGLRDEGLLESVLARPRNLRAYEGVADVLALAASYGVALAKNHAFNDGNKRIAFIATLTFAAVNGWRVEADQAEAAAMMLEVAAGGVGTDGLAAWLREHARPRR